MSGLHKLSVFICHASEDKSIVRNLYQKLNAEEGIDPWLDEEKILPGQDWSMEIERAVEAADAVIVCLSNRSVTKEGFIQRELQYVLDIALEKAEGTMFVIPLRLEDVQLPRRLRSLHYLDFFPDTNRNDAYKRLMRSLSVRMNQQSDQNSRELTLKSSEQKVVLPRKEAEAIFKQREKPEQQAEDLSRSRALKPQEIEKITPETDQITNQVKAVEVGIIQTQEVKETTTRKVLSKLREWMQAYAQMAGSTHQKGYRGEDK